MSIEFYRGQKLTCAAEDYLDGPGHSGPKSAKKWKKCMDWWWLFDNDYVTHVQRFLFLFMYHISTILYLPWNVNPTIFFTALFFRFLARCGHPFWDKSKSSQKCRWSFLQIYIQALGGDCVGSKRKKIVNSNKVSLFSPPAIFHLIYISRVTENGEIWHVD